MESKEAIVILAAHELEHAPVDISVTKYIVPRADYIAHMQPCTELIKILVWFKKRIRVSYVVSVTPCYGEWERDREYHSFPAIQG